MKFFKDKVLESQESEASKRWSKLNIKYEPLGSATSS